MVAYCNQGVQVMDTYKHVEINEKNSRYIGMFEMDDNDGGYDIYDVVEVDGNKLVFGSPTNSCFLQSGYMDIIEYESLDENLQALHTALEHFALTNQPYDGYMHHNN